MIESAILQGAFKLCLALTAIALARGMLLWFDRSINDNNFGTTIAEASPDARIVYYAARFVGVCLVVGLAIS